MPLMDDGTTTADFINMALNLITWILIVRTWWVVEIARGDRKFIKDQIRAVPHDVEHHRKKMNP